MTQSKMRRLAWLFTFPMCFAIDHATANEASGAAVVQMVAECLRVPANRTKDVAGAWDKATFRYNASAVSEADKLNGVEGFGLLIVDVPVRTASTDWGMGEYWFNVWTAKGTVSINRRFSQGLIIESDNWSCEFTGGRRVVRRDLSDATPYPNVVSNPVQSGNGALPMMPPGATEAPH
jgi:hypothetical protein